MSWRLATIGQRNAKLTARDDMVVRHNVAAWTPDHARPSAVPAIMHYHQTALDTLRGFR
jgi:hypothetical protein